MPTPLRALILEDRLSDLDLILHELRRAGFDTHYHHVDNEADYTSSLDSDYDVILADYNLPQFDALRALRILQEKGMRVPFIVVTGRVSEEAAVACMKSGATDYLLKDRLARLGPAIVQALDARKNREAKVRAEEQILNRNRELVLLNCVISASTKVMEEQALLKSVCEELARALDVSYVFIALFNEKRTAAIIVAEHCDHDSHSMLNAVLPIPENPMGEWLAGLKGPLVVDDLPSDPSLSKAHNPLVAHGAESLALLPITVEGKAVGGLGMVARKSRHFSAERMDLLRSVADELSNAIIRTRLERDRLRLSTAVEQISDAVIIIDIDGTVIYVNPGFERMTGYTRAEAIGRPLQILGDGGQDLDFFHTARETPLSQGVWRGRQTNRKKDGSPYTVETSLSPIRDANGDVINYIGVQHDITEELQLEQRYLHSQKMEAVGRLAGGVAHDFNNLLTTIMGYAGVLYERIGPDGPTRADLVRIQSAAEKAATLTRQLLAFSRKQVLQQRIVNVNDIVAEMEEMLKPLIGEDIELRAELDPRLGLIKSDPGQIEQVIMNLAVNARDAMPNGGRITVSTANAELDYAYVREHPGSREGSYVMFTVADTGTGISDEALPHVFEPFFTTKEEGKGTGLGLATVYAIVKQNDGYIWLSSVQGKGTTFQIYIPRFEGTEAKLGARHGYARMPQGTERILLVEDDEQVRDIAYRILANQGYTVSVAKNPEEALKYVERHGEAIDILISDMVMPGMGGKDLAYRIKASHPKVKVLFISGYTDTALDFDVQRDFRMGFLQKPFSPRSLAQTVREILDG